MNKRIEALAQELITEVVRENHDAKILIEVLWPIDSPTNKGKSALQGQGFGNSQNLQDIFTAAVEAYTGGQAVDKSTTQVEVEL